LKALRTSHRDLSDGSTGETPEISTSAGRQSRIIIL
jgi:hypothetical protein